MASPAAMKMYNSLSPAEKAAVDASTAGNPNGIEDWYQAAAAAGDPRAIRAGGAGQSEDFERFNAGTVTGWAQGYYDEAASRAAGRPQFRSMRGAEGFFDKPTECPPGTGPSGPNETDPCTSVGYGGQAAAPGAAAPAGGAGAGGVQGGYGARPWSPLQDLLINQGGYLRGLDSKIGDNQPGIRGGVVGGGGIWYQPTGSITAPKKEVSFPTGPRAGGGPAGGWIGGPVQPGQTLQGPAGLGGKTGGQDWLNRPAQPGQPGQDWNRPLQPFQAPRGTGLTPPVGGRPANPTGGFATNTSGLAAAMMPYQTPQTQQQTGGLIGMMAPWQKRKQPGMNWF